MYILNWAVLILTVAGIIFSGWAIIQASAAYHQAANQFTESGAVFELHPLTFSDEGMSEIHVYDDGQNEENQCVGGYPSSSREYWTYAGHNRIYYEIRHKEHRFMHSRYE